MIMIARVRKDLKTMTDKAPVYGVMVVTAVISIAVTLGGVFFTGTFSNKIEIERLAGKVEQLDKNIQRGVLPVAERDLVRLTAELRSLTAEVRGGMDDRYKGADAARDFKLVFAEIRQITQHQEQNAAAIKENADLIRKHMNGGKH